LIKELLGHLDPETTERYIFRGERRRRRAVEKITVPYREVKPRSGGRRGRGRKRRGNYKQRLRGRKVEL
jgi:hypothetical protein